MTTAEDRQEFGRALRDARRAKGLTQQDVADTVRAAGMPATRQAVSGWEAGEYAPGRDVVELLEMALAAEGNLLITLGYASRQPNTTELLARIAELEKRLADGFTYTEEQVRILFDEVHRTKAEMETIASKVAELIQLDADEPSSQRSPVRGR